MKIKILPIIWLVLHSAGCLSQSLVLSDDFRNLANGSDLYISGPSDTLQLISWLHITNSGNSAKQVLMKKQDISLLPGATTALCWGGYCYGTEMTQTTFPLEMLPGQTESGCFTHYGPAGQRGEGVVRVTFFDAGNPADSIGITMHFLTFGALVGEAGAADFKVITTGGRVTLTFNPPDGPEAAVEIYTLAGTRMDATGVPGGIGKVSFNTSGWHPGIYIAVLTIDGKPAACRKMLVGL